MNEQPTKHIKNWSTCVPKAPNQFGNTDSTKH